MTKKSLHNNNIAGWKIAATVLTASFAVGVSGVALAKKSEEAHYSDKFKQAAGPMQDALAKAKGKAVDAATLADLKTKLDAAIAAVSTPDDKFLTGQYAINVGSMGKDQSLLAKGVRLELDSGKASPEMLPKLHNYAGEFALQDKDYTTAISEEQAAIAAGNTTADPYVTLAEGQFHSNQIVPGLDSLQKAITLQNATTKPAPDGWYKRGIGIAYKAKLLPQLAQLTSGLVSAYPTRDNWTLALDTLRDIAAYTPSEELDLMRLMGHTNSYTAAGDYLEYVQDLDPRRLPGEAQGVLNAGIAAGKLNTSEATVADALHTASSRIAADKASLPGLDRSAHAASASGHLLMAAGDAFLNYSQPAKAMEFYQLALTKPGVDANVANTRIGIAQCDAGDYVGAQATFAKIDGPRAPLAQLWGVYAKLKAAGK